MQVNANCVPAPAGPIPANVPEEAADHRPTKLTVVAAGTFKAEATEDDAFELADAADQVTATRAYAGDPPASSFVPDAE